MRATTNKARSEINAAIMKTWLDTKAKSFLLTEECPQCSLPELNTYKISDTLYLCECQACSIHGRGETHAMALKNTFDVVGDNIGLER
ncbi:hypothetical protein [Aeromonas sp. MdU4]|uniref:hypothetical protein n=1 Tax=Aeromonas sp. MdU4 TaxID=3342819 RepID=UPI0035B729B9